MAPSRGGSENDPLNYVAILDTTGLSHHMENRIDALGLEFLSSFNLKSDWKRIYETYNQELDILFWTFCLPGFLLRPCVPSSPLWRVTNCVQSTIFTVIEILTQAQHEAKKHWPLLYMIFSFHFRTILKHENKSIFNNIVQNGRFSEVDMELAYE